MNRTMNRYSSISHNLKRKFYTTNDKLVNNYLRLLIRVREMILYKPTKALFIKLPLLRINILYLKIVTRNIYIYICICTSHARFSSLNINYKHFFTFFFPDNAQ